MLSPSLGAAAQYDLQSTDYTCEGVTAVVDGVSSGTNQAYITMISKTLEAGVPYVLELPVTNPVVPTTNPGEWVLQSYWKEVWYTTIDIYNVLDKTVVPGFVITQDLNKFSFYSGNTDLVNADHNVSWVFTVAFEEQVLSADTLVLQAPTNFTLDIGDDDTCRDAFFVSAHLSNVPDTCAEGPCSWRLGCTGNTLVVSLSKCPGYTGTQFGLCFDQRATFEIGVTTTNPGSSPFDNYFVMSHYSSSFDVESSATLACYTIIPGVHNPAVSLYPLSSGNVARAVGSESSVLLSFVPVADALLVGVEGAVGDDSFGFHTAEVRDADTGSKLVTEAQSTTSIFFTATLVAGVQVNFLLNFLSNAASVGVSRWNITTYTEWTLVGLSSEKVNEILFLDGPEVLSFISILSSSTLTPKYYGTAGATAAIDILDASTTVVKGHEVVVTAPSQYSFSTASVLVTQGLEPKIVRLSSNFHDFGRFTMVMSDDSVDTLYLSDDGLTSLWWDPEARTWNVGPDLSSALTGSLGEAYVSVGDDSYDAVPSIATVAGPWHIGTTSGWTEDADLQVFGEGSLDLGGQRLTFTLGSDYQANTRGSFRVIVDLPQGTDSTLSMTWTLEARSSDGIVYGTNDGLFTGFSLVHRVAFSVVPMLNAPGATTSLTLSITQEWPFTADYAATFVLSAPDGFSFATSCPGST